MDYIVDLGIRALGTRLRRLSDRACLGVGAVYEENGFEFEPRWFACVCLLRDQGPMGVTDIADSLGLTHPAIHQLSRILERRGIIEAGRDSNDERRRLLSLTPTGVEMAEGMEPLWSDIETAAQRWVDESGIDLMGLIQTLEDLLDQEPMDERIRREQRRRDYEEIVIEPLGDGDDERFAELNRASIEETFEMEDEDMRVLYRPRQAILEMGGRIYMARMEGETVGTCALLKINDEICELTKMAVDPGWRGRQVGARLCDHVIEEARTLGAKSLVLQTSHRLTTAIQLYRSRGMIEDPSVPGDDYERSTFRMRLDLTGSPA